MQKNIDVCDSKDCFSESAVFVITPHTIQEIPEGTVFEGINKPKFIVESPSDNLMFKKDNEYRSGNRHIMLSIRTKKWKIKIVESCLKDYYYMNLLILCVITLHIEEEGNHQEDFHKSEAFLKEISKSEPCSQIELEILK